MANILIQAPELGLNSQITGTMIDPREAAQGSKNVLYRNGMIETDYGFSKLGLTTTGLDSGSPILSVFPFREIDLYEHLMSVTKDKIYEYNPNTDSWTDKTQSGKAFNADLNNPISSVEIAHNSDIHLDDDSSKDNAYYHLIVCSGGNSDIQRWAGRYESDFADVVGAGGYHDGTTHRALQVGCFRNRLLLLSPKTYSSTDKRWSENNQRIQYPVIGKLETWTGTGSGFLDLLDTGGKNVWSAPMGGQYIVYQDKGIWTINVAGGSTVFSPIPYFPNLGLLGSKLIYNLNNVHYFVGTDYNIYAYYGGTTIQNIGTKIQKYFEDDITKEYPYRCRICMDKKNEFLWIWIVKDGDETITKAYGMNIKTGAWMIRDLSDKFSSTTGITSVSLVGASSYEKGESYAQALDNVSLFDVSGASDATERYGDVLTCTTKDWAGDWSTVTIDAGGQDFSKAAGNFSTDFTTNDILFVSDGSVQTNVRQGHHYYTVYDVSTNGFSIQTAGRSSGVDYGIADASTSVPAFDGTAKSTIWLLTDPTGESYNDIISLRKYDEAIHIGDATGFVYYFGSDFTDYAGTPIDSYHYSPEIDLQMPDVVKKWPGITVTAKGEQLGISYKIDDISWVDLTVKDLSTNWKPYNWYINRSGKKIQFRKTKLNYIGPELIKNGTFDSSAYWVNLGDWTIDAGKAHSGDGNELYQSDVSIVANEKYMLVFDLTTSTSGAIIFLLGGQSSSNYNYSEQGTHIEYLTATDTTDKFVISVTGVVLGSGEIVTDNVSLKHVPSTSGNLGKNFQIKEFQLMSPIIESDR